MRDGKLRAHGVCMVMDLHRDTVEKRWTHSLMSSDTQHGAEIWRMAMLATLFLSSPEEMGQVTTRDSCFALMYLTFGMSFTLKLTWYLTVNLASFYSSFYDLLLYWGLFYACFMLFNAFLDCCFILFYNLAFVNGLFVCLFKTDNSILVLWSPILVCEQFSRAVTLKFS